jgi:hypothetical protein
MMRSWRPRASGACVNMTPAACASTMRWITTAIPTSRTPCAARYASARPDAIDAHTARTASAIASPPRAPSRDSARPAIETRVPSSQVALERTARPQGESLFVLRQSCSSSSASPFGSGARSSCCRASAARVNPARPPAARRRTRGSHPGGSSRSAIAKASSGRTQASGTAKSWRTSQASRAAFPPTARASSPPRRRASVSMGISHTVMLARY